MIVQADRRSDLLTESRLLAYLFQEVQPEGTATLEVIRGGRRETVKVRMPR